MRVSGRAFTQERFASRARAASAGLMMNTRICLLPLVLLLPLALHAGPASAQAKRDPTREYRPYTPPPPDKHYGLPSLARPDAGPQERTMATPDEPSRRPSFYDPPAPADPSPRGSFYDAAKPADSSSAASFYDPDGGGGMDLLPSKEARLPKNMETPVFTTPSDTMESTEQKTESLYERERRSLYRPDPDSPDKSDTEN